MVQVRDGDITLGKQLRMGYLEQKGVSGVLYSSTRSEGRMERLAAATTVYEAAEARLTEDTSEEALTELENLPTEFENVGGYTVDQKVGTVLKGLGFLERHDKSCSEFSGGCR